ncbi:MAG: NAD kinase [Bacteroidota bacterium]
MKLALYMAFSNESTIKCCKEIIGLVSDENSLIIDSKLKKELSVERQNEFIFFDSSGSVSNDIDYVIAVGGDGTILRSITYVKDSGIPILGINAGRLGFLTSTQKENLKEGISKIKNNEYKLIKRSLLKLESNNDEIIFSYALNEITIQRKDSTSMLNIACSINGNYLTNYWSDGLIISTPTGSTGYSLSNGGSIVSPESEIIILNPIAPHNINMRSLIIPDNSKIKIDIEGNDDINLSLDSRMHSFSSKDSINISKSNFSINTIKFDDDNFYKRLREKLYWGQDLRNLENKN